MARKNVAPPSPEDVNDGQIPVRKPEGRNEPDLSFDPAELEAEAPAAPPEPAGRDPFDPAFLGLSQDFAGEAKVARQWEIVKVEKPSAGRVFRVHPTMCLSTMLLVLKEKNEVYMVAPTLRDTLADEPLCGLYRVFACVSREGTPFLWHVRLPGRDGKSHLAHQSALAIAINARERWTRMIWNSDAGHYVPTYDRKPPEQQQPPEWPDWAFRDWLERAFKGFTISSLDHPILKRLRLED
jgi:hypothetical protein